MRQIIRKLAVSLALLPIIWLFILDSTAAQSRRACPQLKEPLFFSVTVTPKNIKYNLRLSQQQIIRLAKRPLRARPDRGSKTLGLTTVAHVVKSSYQDISYQIGPNRYCARLASLELEIKITDLKVYSLRKYPRGSCQYKAIVDHEHEHVVTFQNAMKSLERDFTSKLPRIIEKSPAVIGVSPLQARQTLRRNLNHNIDKIRNRVLRKMNARNRQIDTPLSYKRISQKCSKW
ncbi:MAG: hypothetical protein HON14_11715 [Rhodospirillaceae bacterium]|jgi:hypothetical protein|nr:hypothetical protein [Rhodospirillaceae bacterium]MBT4589285.1 hypothetical protein [Rhodospirillaceae bacterium]MBT4939793.1 hypothetical protein [Rhodospirillaceae bacterium]